MELKKKTGGAAEYKVDQIGTMVINPISWDITPNNYSYIHIYIYPLITGTTLPSRLLYRLLYRH